MSKSEVKPKRHRRIATKTKNSIIGYGKQLDATGLVLATVFFCFSMLPSLLPRPWLYQGVISGISIAAGYGIGAAISALVRWAVDGEIRVPKHIQIRAWKAFALIGPGIILLYLYLGTVWQNEVRQLVGEPTVSSHYYFRTLFIVVAVAIGLLAIARSIRRLTQFTARQLDRIMPRRVGVSLGVLLVAVLLWWIVSGVFYNFFVTASNNIYRQRNSQTPPGVSQPTSSDRSGSPASLIPWDTLGRQGQAFVASGPSNTLLETFNNAPTTDPIRTYVGLDSAANPTARAELAVKELERTGAFQRKVLILATATGTGWLEPQAVDSLEYMYNGNSAIVAQQYSYLPSWISFLIDKQNARDAGRALFDAVYAKWVQLPAEQRPKLIAYGLSLGSFGGQAAYSGVNDLRHSVDGALFVGTPNDTELWRTITDQREAGSPEWQPVYEKGVAVRFAATNTDIAHNQTTWQQPRVLYLQHASDPVVWFSFDLLINKPDWLAERRGPDVSPATRWYPIVTFLQVGIDQFFGTTVPNGHGHNYANTMVTAWGAIAPPDGWSQAKTEKLQTIIDQY